MTSDPFYKQGLISILSWISKHMLSYMWDEIIYTFPNVNGAMYVFIYPYWG